MNSMSRQPAAWLRHPLARRWRRCRGSAQTPAEINAALAGRATPSTRTCKEGKNADYIPALAKVESEHLRHRARDGRRQGLHGRRHHDPRSRSSRSRRSSRWRKVIEDQGPEAIVKTSASTRPACASTRSSRSRCEKGWRARDEPARQPGRDHGDQHGARARPRDEIWDKILGTYSDFAGRPLTVNQEVYKSEADTNQRNQAIGMLMFAYGHIKDNPAAGDRHLHAAVLGRASTRRTWRSMAATLANGGRNPVTEKQVIDVDERPRGAGRDGDRRALRRLGQVALSHRPAGEERRGRRHHRRVARQVRHRRDLAAARRAGNSVRAQKAIADISNALGGNPLAAKPQRPAVQGTTGVR